MKERFELIVCEVEKGMLTKGKVYLPYRWIDGEAVIIFDDKGEQCELFSGEYTVRDLYRAA
ncbi:hypothetical protein [Halobacteriovorax sp. ZH2_bin.1]|uniref:hypothetical protein n=1 Tax=unclassified Halobacteriovorax TaxID=2639665 RepID=UPI00371BB111